MRRIFYIIGLSIAVMLSACSRPEPTVDHTALLENVRSTDKLVLARMAVTKTVKSERDAWYKIGKRIAVYSYDNYLRAYIDLTQLNADDFTFDDTQHTVELTLPPIEVEIEGRDMVLHKEYENIGLLRSHLDSKERAEMKEKANKDFVKEMERDPHFKQQLTETAQRKARQYFESMMADYGYTATIRFKQ